MTAAWFVCKRDGRWRVYDRGVWHDTYDSLPDAHSAALAYTLSAELFTRGGLVRFAALRDAADWWAAYEKTCEGISE